MTIGKPKSYNLYTPEQWFRNLLDQMIIELNPNRPNKTYYMISGEMFMVYNSETSELRYNYYQIYLVLRHKFNLLYQQMNVLIKDVMIQRYGLWMLPSAWTILF